MFAFCSPAASFVYSWRTTDVAAPDDVQSNRHCYRSCGGMSRMLATKVAISSTSCDSVLRIVDAGCWARESPGLHSRAGRIGRGAKPPPQFGHTLESFVSTQLAQNVHSYVQIRASVESGGRSASQYSQLGRSSRAIGYVTLLEAGRCMGRGVRWQCTAG